MQRTQTLNYEDFLHRLPQAKDMGNYIVGVCPFHPDSSPSLLVFKDGWFHCLGADCARSGTWQTLWDKLAGRPIQLQPESRIHYQSPAKMLEVDYDAPREEGAYRAYLDLVHFPTFQWYLEMRGIDDAIDIHEIGYHRGWYTIPVWDHEYKFQNVVFRAAPHVQKAIGMRYWTDGQPTIYVPDWHQLDKCDYIVVVFGIFDALTLNKYRFPVVSPTHGHVFDPNWLNGYRKPVYLIPDKGEERSVLRMIGGFGWRGKMIRLDWPDGMKDVNDFLVAGKEEELLAQLSQVIR